MLNAAEALHDAARGMPPTLVMEVCGTHTHAIARYALRQTLPPELTLVSGPGCPVCVTDGGVLAQAVFLCEQPNVTVFSFGDMLRVSAAGGESLLRRRERGADVRIALSPMDVLEAAKAEPGREFVWLAVGFETTAPLTAAMLVQAQAQGVQNLSVLCAHKTMPAALRVLLRGNTRIQALLLPGHVTAITGTQAFSFVAQELGIPGAVAGFAPGEMLFALTALARARARGEAQVVNAYPQVVTREGNRTAQKLLEQVFVPCDARWRGLGEIADSGLALRAEFSAFDAARRFSLPEIPPEKEEKGCLCASILRGECGPADCPLFGRICVPERPRGPCMVSSEGACAAAYRYG